MNKIKIVILALLCVINSNAQIITSNLFLQGKYLEIGAQQNASLGTGVAAPVGYHPRNSGSPFVCGSSSPNFLASVYDYGLDGWTVGTPPYMGDYTLPGSPWESWGIEVNGTREWAYSTNCNLSGGLTTTTGSWTSYSNTGGRALGYWNGSFLSGNLLINQEYRIDTLSSALVVTVKLKNVGTTTLNNVYYLRSCDPDNSVPWGGSFTTNNIIQFQNDFYHRVMVSATSTGASGSIGVPPTILSLGTKDTRAKCLIFSSWPLSTTVTYSSMWAGTSTGIGTSYYTVGGGSVNDIAIGLVFNLCNIPPGDSTICSYAYIYNSASSMIGSLDTTFPEPKLIVNGTAMDSVDTITTCIASSGIANLNVINGSDKSWSWSSWTWSPGIGLSSTTGVNTTLTMSYITSITTFTITGIDTTHCRQLHKTFLLTVIPIVSASPVVRDTSYCQYSTSISLASNITGIGALKWYTTPTGGTGTLTAPIPSTTVIGTTTWWVTQIIAGCESNRVPIKVTINPTYNINLPVSICKGTSYTFNGNTYTTTGTYPNRFSTTLGCDSVINIVLTIKRTDTLNTIDSICQGDKYVYGGNTYTTSGQYSVHFINDVGCDSTMNLTLKVRQNPDATIKIIPTNRICVGDTIKVTSSNEKYGPLNYTWNFNDAYILITTLPQEPYYITYYDSGAYTISLIVNNDFCHSDTIKSNIEVEKYPSASIKELGYDVCIGDKVFFEPLNPIQGIIYYWTPIWYFESESINGQSSITGIVDISREVTLMALSKFGCISKDSVSVLAHSCCIFSIPSAFTPNNDGLNDIFSPIMSGNESKIHEFSIYNRWGQQIYTSKLLATKGWDGSFNKIPQDLGVYFWILDYECEGKTHLEKGDVTLIR